MKLALLLFLVLLALTFAAEPVAIASFYTLDEPISVGKSVTFDASASFDSDGDTLYYYFDYGDGNSKLGTTTSSVTHSYSTAGMYRALVTVSDNNNGSISNSQVVTKSGQAAPTVYLSFEVFSSDQCYGFKLFIEGSSSSKEIIIAKESEIRVYIQIEDPADPSSTSKSKALTEEFFSQGERPYLTFSNTTMRAQGETGGVAVVEQHLDSVHHAWTLPLISGNTSDTVGATIHSNGVYLLGCSVKDTDVSITIQNFPQPIGAAQPALLPSSVGSSIRSNNFFPTSLQISTDACSPDAGITLLQAPFSTAENGLGGLLVVSEDAFGSASVVHNLLYTPDNVHYPYISSSVCTGGNCASMIVYSLAVTSARYALLTSRGLLVSTDPESIQPLLFSSVATGNSLVDTPSLAATLTNATLWHSDACPIPRQENPYDFVYLSFYGNSQWQIMFSGRFLLDKWYSFSPPAALALNSSERYVAVLHRDYSTSTIVLIARTEDFLAARTVVQYVNPSINSNDFVYAPTDSDFQAGFTFPTSSALRGMTLHASGHEIIAFGGALWLSYDGGYSFDSHATLPSGEVITQVVTATSQGSLAALTSLSRVFYARTSVVGWVQVPTILYASTSSNQGYSNHPRPQLSGLFFSAGGRLYSLSLDRMQSGTYPASTSDYPVGLLADNSSTLLRSPMLQRTLLPVNASLQADDLNLHYSMAITPSAVRGTVTLYANAVNGLSFLPQHVGRGITLAE